MKIYQPLIITLIVFLSTANAYAQLANTDLSTTVGISSASCIAADASRKTLTLENPKGNTQDIGYCVGSGCTAVLGGSGTSVLTPGTIDFWSLYTAPVEQLNCIAGAASTPLTARSQK